MPSNTLIGAIRVEASIDAGKFVDGAKLISNTSKATERTVKSAFSGISSAIKGGIAGFTGALSVAGFVTLVQSSLDFAKGLQSASQQLGVSTKDLQTYRFAASQVSVTNDQLDSGFRVLEKSIGKAIAGSEPMQKAFASVGVSLQDLETKSRPEIFNQVADGMAKQGGAARNAAAATAIFGKSASDLNPLLDQGSAGINNLAQAAQDLGVVLSDQQIQAANETATKLANLKEVLQANIASDVVANANAILNLADALADLIRWTGQATQGWKLMIAEMQSGVPSAARGFVSGALNGLRRGGFLGAVGGSVVGALRGYGQGGDQADEDFKIHSFLAAHNEPLPSRVQRPTGNVPQFLSPPKAPKTAAARQPADRSDELLAQFKRDELTAQQQILQAQQQLAGSAEERLQLSVASINLDKLIQDAQIDEKVGKAKRQLAANQITASAYREVVSEAAIEKAQADAEASLKLRALVEEQLARQEQAVFEGVDQQYKFQQDALHTADQLATTAADHRRIQLQILDSEIEQQRLELEHQKQLAIRNGATEQEIANIQAQINNLPSQQAQQAALIVRNTQSPFEAWMQDIPKTRDEMLQAFQQVDVDGLDSFIDKITQSGDAFKHLGQTVLQTGEEMALSIAKLILKMELMRLLSSVLGLTSAIPSPNVGAAASVDLNTTSLVPSSADFSFLPGFATGGTIMVGGRTGTDRNILSMNGLPIARVSYGEPISIGAANDGPMGPQLPPLTMYNDFRGADPAAVASIGQRLDQMQAEFPYRVVQAWYDAYSRNVIRP